MADLKTFIPGLEFYKRAKFELKQIVAWAAKREYTHVLVVNEKHKKCNQLIVCHLPNGPTAHFKLTNVQRGKDIVGHGRATHHRPEVVLNHFSTRLGHRVGRLLGSLFPHDPQFRGRTVATFHNQRDFIFVRHHRYVFDSAKQARLQELGPQFTLKMRWLQDGMFDTKFGHYEWFHRRKEQDKSRRTFHL